MSTSGIAFHTINQGNYVGISGGIIPDPVVLGTVEMIVDGQLTTITATSGVEQYIIVEPGDYPLTEMEREMRRGTVPGK